MSLCRLEFHSHFGYLLSHHSNSILSLLVSLKNHLVAKQPSFATGNSFECPRRTLLREHLDLREKVTSGVHGWAGLIMLGSMGSSAWKSCPI